MEIRKEKARSKYLTSTDREDELILYWSQTPETAALDSKLPDKLETGLNRLDSDRQSALVLRHAQGLTNKEASAVLGIGVANLESRLKEARIILRRSLNMYLADGAQITSSVWGPWKFSPCNRSGLSRMWQWSPHRLKSMAKEM